MTHYVSEEITIPMSLRVCLTNRCNYNCRFCHKEGELKVKKKFDLDFDNLIFFMKYINSRLSTTVESISLTGGDPFLHPKLHEIIIKSKTLGVKKVSVTTNAALIGNHLEQLSNLPIDELHISLNTLNKDKYYYLIKKSRKTAYFENVMGVLDNNCFKKNKFKIIINSLLLNGKEFSNISELDRLIDFANSKGYLIIFWEVLKVNSFSERNFFKITDIFDILDCDIKSKEPYRWFYIYTLDDGRKFGVAKCLCTNFCIDKPSDDCKLFNSLHITPDFKIKKCMFSTNYIKLSDLITQKNIINNDNIREYFGCGKDVTN